MVKQMKKILFIIQQLDCGGVEKALINLLNLIDRDVYDCELYVIRKEGNFIPFLPKWLKVKEYKCPCYVKDMLERIQKPIIKSEDDIQTKLDKFFWICIFYINKILRKFFKKNILYKVVFTRYKSKNNIGEYDALIDFHGYGSFTTYLAAMSDNNAKKISWIHEQNIYYAYRCISGVYKKFNHIFGCSKDCCNNFINVFPHTKDNVSVYYNYLDVAEIKQKAEQDIPELNRDNDIFKIVSIGRVGVQKSFRRAIEATEILKNKKLKFRWIIIGNGEQLEELREEVKKKKLDDYISFIGFSENPYPYIKNSDLYVQTSIAEGFCTTISEAIILGKAVVSTDVSGVREQLEYDKGGIVVEHSAEKIANAIEDLMRDKIKLQNMSKYNREKNMDFNREVDKLYKEINK